MLTSDYTGHRNIDSSSALSRREPMQTVTKLLLLSMFAFAARYWNEGDGLQHAGSEQDKLEAGHQYANDARLLLSMVTRHILGTISG